MDIKLNNSPSFNAKISQRFLTPAKRYLEDASYRQQANFEDNLDMFSKMPYTEDITISYERTRENDELRHSLVAQKGDKKVVLSTKDQFRKIVEKFSNMSEYEFRKKWEQNKGI